MLKVLTNPYSSWALLCFALVTLFVCASIYAYFFAGHDPYMLSVAASATIGCVGIVIGFHMPFFDRWMTQKTVRIWFPSNWLQIVIWGSFLVYVATVLATAESIPILSALGGATAQALSEERGGFLKTRSGWQAVLPYIGTVFVGVILPYATARLVVERSKWGILAAAVFVIYTLLSLEKSLFILALAPVAYLIAQKRVWTYKAFFGLLILAAGILYLNTVLSRGVDSGGPMTIPAETQDEVSGGLPFDFDSSLYFSPRYLPSGALDQIIWRSVSVTVFTAADAFRVFDEKFGGRPFFGATSSFVAKVTGQDRVNYDAEVFGYQFGMSDIGRANSVYVTEAYVNFGYVGVVVFSLLIGLALRLFAKSDDEAFRAMWPLFCWYIFTAGLMGTMLSNGFALLFAFGLLAGTRPSGQGVDVVSDAAA